ncbi:hypothetical protein IWZ03DRAFT_359836 [Phyllosticta citriasiana]|uniref:Uncharacterized protein n=1 Tax=Phyllosticta citriasiana TaxID=595635 RepID=A0ABR1KMR8_9PEZI
MGPNLFKLGLVIQVPSAYFLLVAADVDRVAFSASGKVLSSFDGSQSVNICMSATPEVGIVQPTVMLDRCFLLVPPTSISTPSKVTLVGRFPHHGPSASKSTMIPSRQTPPVHAVDLEPFRNR